MFVQKWTIKKKITTEGSCPRRTLEGWEEKVAVGGWLETVNPLSDKTTLHNKGLNGPLHQQEYYSE